MNIMAELNRMDVSIIHHGNGISFRGKRASEAIRRFKSHKQSILDEVGKYHESKTNGAAQDLVDMARSIASAWSWGAEDWEMYWSDPRHFDADEEVKKLFSADIEISPWRYECDTASCDFHESKKSCSLTS
jgi:hypothetical protein